MGKSTVLKQTIARLCADGVDPRRICYFAADALSTFNDLINLFQTSRLLLPDLADQPRYFLLDGAIDLEQQVPGVMVLSAALFAWLLDQHG